MIFQQSSTDLAEMPWFGAVEEFSNAENSTESKRDDDPDQEVLPRVIEKTVLPKIAGMLRLSWKCLCAVSNQTISDNCQIMLDI